MQKITSMLWFDTEAEEAARFYASIFDGSKVGTITRYGDAAAEASGRPKGSVMTVEFEIEGQKFVGLNGGPQFHFSEAISFVVNCKDQKEVDTLWAKLTAGGGEPSACGWLKDKFGLSWQIVPAKFWDLIEGDPARAERVMAALMQMTKIDLATLEKAAKG